MAMVKCDECGKGISSKADVCPHCGVRRVPSGGAKFVGILMVAIGVFLLLSSILDFG